MFKGLAYETTAEETARLADAPIGSINHELSQLPVINDHPHEDQVVELTRDYQGHRIIGVLTNQYFPPQHAERTPRRHTSSWDLLALIPEI